MNKPLRAPAKRRARFGLAVIPLVFPLAGCGPHSPMLVPARVTPEIHSPFSGGRESFGRRTARRSQALLYVSNLRDVTVYSYPSGEFVSKLKGFDIANGQCVDKRGDIYITDYLGGLVVEYAHGGTERIKTLHVGGEGPLGCAIDPTTGNLAVGEGAGKLQIFKGARGNPITYKSPDFKNVYFPGYDPRGNLFVDGNSALGAGHVVFGELPKGGRALKTITLNQYLGWPGGVQWDGKHIAVGDPTTPTIYQFSVDGDKGTKVGETHLGSGAYNVGQFFIEGQTLLAPSECKVYGPKCHASVLFYRYPAGGKAFARVTKDIYGSFGASVSLLPGLP